ncbi:hypothetical protein A3H38_03550 [candidate division WOR-1 bacterium RIFCSPLOWO2_02_FULL_46_20]|uniref:MPN domain-containing protein n=2 Tax=Saganbacteria TaxID=1703751 RepID=A0A1F4RFZ1_UNCSA|nr:MAG: hypothetical protein A3J44_02900 [candidate division WOR-1 bacterium RIFCSPHIGHO2_02_FULL_45_12]OGC07102.1 MAG: hypothetical protein A3H38_03550 [candidate division WOR-1 bacterium RIFCSPLOWO2_02_FULL_46_20]OGC07970.1 MAG: hypothetical protein A3F86_05895 [candidate division WOR-1 bacterium RIFCSPLOWO2_12_FULL_45_9]
MLIINEKLKFELIEQVRQEESKEACGILAGRRGQVEKVYQIKNASDSPESCYFMEPREQLKVMKELRAQSLEMVGIYHSHPKSEAYPSARDVELAFYSALSYVIIYLPPHGKIQFRSFRIVEGKIAEEEIKT